MIRLLIASCGRCWVLSPAPAARTCGSCRQQLWQPREIAGRHGHRELRSDPLDAAVDGLGHTAHGLGPAEGLLDLLAAALGQSIAGMARGSAVDRGMPSLPGDMRRDNHAAQVGDEIGAVVSLVRAQRQPPRRARGVPVNHVERGLAFGVAVRPGQIGLHDETVAVFHQRMTHEAQHRARTRRLLVEPGVRVRDRGVRRVRPFLALEVDFGIARLAGWARHGLGLGCWAGRDGGCEGLVSVGGGGPPGSSS